MPVIIGGVEPFTTVDFPGRLAAVLFFLGCPLRCPYCHNPELQDFKGKPFISWETFIEFLDSRKKLLDGIVFSGGEPFLQSEELIPIAKAAKAKGLSLWAYSGYTFEELLQDETKRKLLELLDVLVDGRFVLALKDYRLKFKGSRNQRIIDVRASLCSRQVVWKELADYGKGGVR